MTSVAHKTNVLMVGAFPLRRAQTVYGGQVAACMRLLDSSFVIEHAVRTLDTTQIANPPPPFIVRLVLAAKRFIRFGYTLFFHRPEVVILFFADGASACEKALMAWVARVLRIRVLVFPRAGSLIETYAARPRFAALMRRTLGRADMFLCQGKAFQNFAIEKLGFTSATAPIIPNWTARPEHLAIGEARVYGRSPACVRLLFLGWLEDFKGVFDLLEAMRMLREQGVSCQLTLGGDGHALPEARRLVGQYGLSDQITFAGWVDDDAKRALLHSSDVFVLPSWSEGLPNAMIEAMSAGLATVVTEVGMIRDYVTDGREALVVPPRAPMALAEALKRLILDQRLRADIGKNGHALAMAQFSLEHGVTRLSEAVSRVALSR